MNTTYVDVMYFFVVTNENVILYGRILYSLHFDRNDEKHLFEMFTKY